MKWCRNVGGSTRSRQAVAICQFAREQVIICCVMSALYCAYCVFTLYHSAAFLLILLTLFIQVVECIAESLSILETPLQVKVRRFNNYLSLSLQRLCFSFVHVPLAVYLPMFKYRAKKILGLTLLWTNIPIRVK